MYKSPGHFHQMDQWATLSTTRLMEDRGPSDTSITVSDLVGGRTYLLSMVATNAIYPALRLAHLISPSVYAYI